MGWTIGWCRDRARSRSGGIRIDDLAGGRAWLSESGDQSEIEISEPEQRIRWIIDSLDSRAYRMSILS